MLLFIVTVLAWLLFAFPASAARTTLPAGFVTKTEGQWRFQGQGQYPLPVLPGMAILRGTSIWPADDNAKGRVEVLSCGSDGKQMTREIGAPGLSENRPFVLAAIKEDDQDNEPSCGFPNLDLKALTPVNPVAALPSQDGAFPQLLERATKAESREHYGDAFIEYANLLVRYPGATWVAGVLQDLGKHDLGHERQIGPAKTVAVVVGVSDFENGIPNLKFAAADAEEFRRFLQSGRMGDTDGAITVLTDRKSLSRICDPVPNRKCDMATLPKFRDAIENFALENAGEKNTLVLFIGTHGMLRKPGEQPGEGFVMLSESMIDNAAATGYPMSQLMRVLSGLSFRYKRVIVFLDLCHAALVNELRQSLAALGNEIFQNEDTKPGSLLVYTASERPAEKNVNTGIAYESPTLTHGVFTYFLLRGLAGEAANKGEKIQSVQEAEYVHKAVYDLLSKRGLFQRPTYWPGEVSETIVDHPEKEFTVKAADLPEHIEFDSKSATRGIRNAEGADYQPKDPGANLTGRDRRIALEEEGNKVILKYLQGEQTPPPKNEFVACGRYFEELWNVTKSAYFEARMRFCQGRAALFEHDLDTAVPMLERAVLLDSRRAYAYNALGIGYLEAIPRLAKGETGRAGLYFRRAEAAFRDAIRLAPLWPYAQHNLALTYMQHGEPDRAIKTYQDAIALHPESSYLAYNLGLLFQKLNLREDAERRFRDADRIALRWRESLISPPARFTERAAAYNALGTLELQDGRLRQAKKWFDRALLKGNDPAYSPALHNRAIWALKKHKYELAVQDWKAVVELEPLFLPARRSLTETLVRLHRYDEAWRYADQGIRLMPDVKEELEAERDDIRRVQNGQPPQTDAYRRIVRSKR